MVGEDLPWQLSVGSALICPWCACVGGLGQCMHIQVSVVYNYVEYRYARAEELRELRRRRMFFKEVNDLFSIALVCSVQLKSCWKVMPRWRCLRATDSSFPSK